MPNISRIKTVTEMIPVVRKEERTFIRKGVENVSSVVLPLNDIKGVKLLDVSHIGYMNFGEMGEDFAGLLFYNAPAAFVDSMVRTLKALYAPEGE